MTALFVRNVRNTSSTEDSLPPATNPVLLADIVTTTHRIIK